jgi:asparagine synthase (glutamine-hydrolysing)
LPEARLKELNRKALSLMVHRGPDDSGMVSGKNWAAGHQRLSIIDLADSHQPMQNPEKTHTLLYNGEIYNYQTLRKPLVKFWPFRTHGDTEVILGGILSEGLDFIRKMEGMWALALWDEKNGSLVLSRDRFGEKPLYYYCREDCFVCASELPSLLELLDRRPATDPVSITDYLRYGYYAPGRTVFSDIYEVLPGHIVEWTPGERPAVRPYWRLSFGTYKGTKKQALEETRELVVAAVKSRMVADVEIGAFLSGGIDSSLIVSILCRDLGLNPKTFCIGFEDKSYDERKYAAIVAARYKTDHYTDVQSFKPEELNKLILDHIGQPFADASILPTSLISKLASAKVKVALSGDGGDELFSGYQKYHARMFMRIVSMFPEFMTGMLPKLLKYIPEPTTHHSRSNLRKAYMFINNYLDNKIPASRFPPTIINEAELTDLFPGQQHSSHIDFSNMPEHPDDVMDLMYQDLMIYLPQDLLTKVDRATMTCSLESRAPFLDSRLVEFTMSLPRHWHRNIFSGKLLLREAFREYLPGETWTRNKQGFGVPLHIWFKGDLGDRLKSMLAEAGRTPINTTLVNHWLAAHVSGSRDYSLKLWAVYVLLLWTIEKNIQF